jgi:hypothetical protein
VRLPSQARCYLKSALAGCTGGGNSQTHSRLASRKSCLPESQGANAMGGAARFRPVKPRQATHVEAGTEVPRDRGSIPRASIATGVAAKCNSGFLLLLRQRLFLPPGLVQNRVPVGEPGASATGGWKCLRQRNLRSRGYRSHGFGHEGDLPLVIHRYAGKIPDPAEVKANGDVCRFLYRG